MRCLALNRCSRAAASETLLAAVFVCLLIVFLRTDAHAQFLPSGCPGTWVQGGGGMMCRCPDGSYANMIGDQIVCNSRGSSGSTGNVCPNGGTCRSDQTCCGNLCCNQGSYCSRHGCTPYGAVDCGTSFCNPGQQCNRNGQCIPAGSVDCGSYYCDAGNVCGSNGGCVPEGKIDCGTYVCDSGFKCSSAKCIAQEAWDCGNGRYCNPGSYCGFNGLCVPNGHIECGDHTCRPGLTCGSNDACMPKDAVDCGDGRYCAAGTRCEAGRCISQAVVRQPNIGHGTPTTTNDDVLFICGAAALAIGLILIEAELRSRKKQRRQEGKVPALPKGSVPVEEPAAASVALVPPDIASEQSDAAGVSEPSSVHDGNPVHANAGVKKVRGLPHHLS